MVLCLRKEAQIWAIFEPLSGILTRSFTRGRGIFPAAPEGLSPFRGSGIMQNGLHICKLCVFGAFSDMKLFWFIGENVSAQNMQKVVYNI